MRERKEAEVLVVLPLDLPNLQVIGYSYMQPTHSKFVHSFILFLNFIRTNSSRQVKDNYLQDKGNN